MKNRLTTFCLIFAFIIMYSNIQVIRVENVTYYPTLITLVPPAITPYPTYTPLTCPTKDTYAIKTSEEGLHFIAYWEGFRNAAYLDARGFCTVGYGHLIREGACRDNDWPLYVTQAQGWILLRDDVSKVDFQIYLTGWTFNQTQWDSISSIIFNMGLPNFQKTRIFEALNNRDYKAVPSIIEKTICCVDSLKFRRKSEAELFKDGIYISSAKNKD